MPLQSEIVSEMHLSANWKPKYRDRTKQAVTKLNLCRKKAVDKSVCVKACHRSKVKLFITGFKGKLMKSKDPQPHNTP